MESKKEIIIDSLRQIQIFRQIQECKDVISAILLTAELIKEHNIECNFDIRRLTDISLYSCDKESCTYLWHVNSLIACAKDLRHFILGLEMMFDRFIANAEHYSSNTTTNKFTNLKINISNNQNPTQNKTQTENCSDSTMINPLIVTPLPSVSVTDNKRRQIVTFANAQNMNTINENEKENSNSTNNDQNLQIPIQNNHNPNNLTCIIADSPAKGWKSANLILQDNASPTGKRMRRQKMLQQANRHQNELNENENDDEDEDELLNEDGDGHVYSQSQTPYPDPVWATMKRTLFDVNTFALKVDAENDITDSTKTTDDI